MRRSAPPFLPGLLLPHNANRKIEAERIIDLKFFLHAMNAECPLASPGDRRGPRDTRHEPGTLAQVDEIYHPLPRKGLPGARFSIGRPAARTRKYEARSGLSSNKAGARRASDQVRGTTDRHGWRNDRASGVAIGPATPIGAWDGCRRARRTRFHRTAQRKPLYGWPTRSELIPDQGRVRWLRFSPIRFIPARTSRSCGRLSAPLGGRAVPAHFPEGPFPVPSLEGRSLRVPVIQQRRAA